MDQPYLRMINIAKSFPGVQALKGVNLDAFAGEALGLVGANGAGKSTLMNVLGGVVRADEGQIEIAGRTVEINGPLRRCPARHRLHPPGARPHAYHERR